MAFWGSLTCLYLAYELSLIHGDISEVWPNRCQTVRASLLSDEQSNASHLDVTFDYRLTQEKERQSRRFTRAQLWSIAAPSTKRLGQTALPPWVIPRRNYAGARIRLNKLSPMWVELYSDDEPSVMLIYEHDESVNHLYQYLLEGSQQSLRLPSGMFDLRGSSSSGALTKIDLEELGYETNRDMISCDNDRFQKEFPLLLSLLHKSADVGIKSATRWDENVWELYSEIKDHRRRTLRRRISSNVGERGIWSVSWPVTLDQRAKSRSQESLLKPPSWLIELLGMIDAAQGSSKRAKELLQSLPARVRLLENAL